MPAENNPASADDLFEDEPQDESPKGAVCSACG